jgi:hypothetical protein
MKELARLGCTEAQGFFFSQPLPVDSAQALLRGRQTRLLVPPPGMPVLNATKRDPAASLIVP